MPAESLKLRMASLPPNLSTQELRTIVQALLLGVQTLASKLDADAANAALNDTNYRAVFDAIIVN